jgi:DNA-binding NarL/FixJ family response regulator
MIQILVASNCPLTRAGINSILTSFNEFSVVNDTTLDRELISKIDKFNTDILIIDINDFDTFDKQLILVLSKHCYPNVKILVLMPEEYHIRELVAAGVTGCLLKKEATIETTVRAIYTIASGSAWFSQSVLINLSQQGEVSPRKLEATSLTNRELQILRMLAQGWSNADIATKLHLAVQTVRNYVSRIYQKLSVDSRAEAIIHIRESAEIWQQLEQFSKDEGVIHMFIKNTKAKKERVS